MSQTNIQVPIENRDPNRYVLENRELARGAERETARGPVQMGETPRDPGTSVLCHGSMQDGSPALDMRYGDNMSRGFKQVMSGRSARMDPSVEDSSARLMLGGGHLPLGKDHPDHTLGGTTPAPEGGMALPKDA